MPTTDEILGGMTFQNTDKQLSRDLEPNSDQILGGMSFQSQAQTDPGSDDILSGMQFPDEPESRNFWNETKQGMQEFLDVGKIGAGMAMWPVAQAAKFGEMIVQSARPLIGMPGLTQEEIVTRGKQVEERLFSLIPAPVTDKGKYFAEKMEDEIAPVLNAAHLAAENAPKNMPIVKEVMLFLGDIVSFSLMGGHDYGKQLDLAKTARFMDLVKKSDKKAQQSALDILKELNIDSKIVKDPQTRMDAALTHVEGRVAEQQRGLTEALGERDRIGDLKRDLSGRVVDEGLEMPGISQPPGKTPPLRSGTVPKTARQIMEEQAGMSKDKTIDLPDPPAPSDHPVNEAIALFEGTLAKSPRPTLSTLVARPKSPGISRKPTTPPKRSGVAAKTAKDILAERAADNMKEMERRKAEVVVEPNTIVQQLTEIFPEDNITYGGVQDRSVIGKGPIYLFTPQTGKLKGRTLSVEDLSADAVKVKMDKMAETTSSKSPSHGTDIDKLEGILNKGLSEGSALDFTENLDWSSDYPIQVIVPDAQKGQHISHNNYYKSKNISKPAKIIIDLDQYTSTGVERVLTQIDTLKKKHSDIEWKVKGEAPNTQDFTVKNLTKYIQDEFKMTIAESVEMARDEVRASDAGDPKNFYGYSKRHFSTIDDWKRYFKWLTEKGKDVDTKKTPFKSTSIQPLNKVGEVIKEIPIELPKSEKSKPLKVDLDRLPDWVEEMLEPLYKRMKSGELKQPKRMHKIAEELLDHGQISDPGLAKTFRKWYTDQKQKIERVDDSATARQLASDEKAGITRVDPETGRKPGGKEYKPAKTSGPDEVTIMAEMKKQEGRVVSERSAKEQAAYDKLMKELWEEQLREEGLGENLGERDQTLSLDEMMDRGIEFPVSNERGAINRDLLIWPATLGKATIKGLAQVKKYIQAERVANGSKRGVPDGHLRFENLSQKERVDLKQVLKEAEAKGQTVADYLMENHQVPQEAAYILDSYARSSKDPSRIVSPAPKIPKESKWLKHGDDPNELMSRRRLRRRKKKLSDEAQERVAKTGKWLPVDFHPETFAPALKRGELAIMEGIKNIPPNYLARHLSFENAIRTFERLGPEIKELWYDSIKDAEHQVVLERKSLKKEMVTLRKTLSRHQYKRIGTYAINEQRGGNAILKAQGISKIPKLTKPEMEAYYTMRRHYYDMFKRLNKARELSGKAPFPETANYFTFVQDLSWAERQFGLTMMDNWKTLEGKIHEHRSATPSWWAKNRAIEKPRKLELDPFTVFDIYSRSVLEYIHKTPEIAKLNELLLERYKVRDTAPESYNFLRQWLDFQAGKTPAWDITHPVMVKGLKHLNKNLAWALLSYSARSAVIQPSALIGTYGMLGAYHTSIGVRQLLSHSKWKFAFEHSKVLLGREFDVSIFESMIDSGLLKTFGKSKKKLAEIGLIPLQALDIAAATATWLGAYNKGMKDFKGKSRSRRASRYADDIVVKTQASAAKSDIAPIQYGTLGKTLTGLQTFVINYWGFLTKDVLGIKNADINNITTLKRVGRVLAATTLSNMFYEDVLEINSPNPTPIRSYIEEMEESGDHFKAVEAAVKELGELVPVLGGPLRYGSEIGGPLVSTLVQLVNNHDYSAIVKLLGIPGANQFFKSLRAQQRGGTAADMTLGRYIEKPKKSSSGLDDLGGLSGFGEF